MEDPEEHKPKPQKSLKYSFIDGIFASLTTGFTIDYFTPFLLLMGGAVRHVGLLSALPNLAASLIQLKSADMMVRLRSRKRVVGIFIFLQALMLLPMIVMAISGTRQAAIFIAAVTLFTSFGAFALPAWGSLMADLVEVNKRGEYFGWRNKLLGFVIVSSTFTAGFILHRAERFDIFLGFALLFSIAFLFRLLSLKFFMKMHEPELIQKDGDYFSLYDFLSRVRTSNFARFVVFVALLKVSVNIASPFFAVLMLKNLQFDYLTYTCVTIASTLSMNFCIKRWGVHADKVGNLKVIKLTSRLVAFVPVLWLINQNPVFLFFVQVFSGFSWSGFNLSTSNFIYDSSTPGKRARCIAYFNFFNGISLCLGAIIGGLLAQKIPAGLFAYGIMNIILISAILRFAVAFLLPIDLKEVRSVEKVKSHELFFRMIKPDFRRQAVSSVVLSKGKSFYSRWQ